MLYDTVRGDHYRFNWKLFVYTALRDIVDHKLHDMISKTIKSKDEALVNLLAKQAVNDMLTGAVYENVAAVEQYTAQVLGRDLTA